MDSRRSPGRDDLRSQVVSINLAELEAPFSDRLIAESDTEVPLTSPQHRGSSGRSGNISSGMTDDLGREAMTMVRRDRMKTSGSIFGS